MDKFLLVYRFEADSLEEAEKFAADVTKSVLTITQDEETPISNPQVALSLVQDKTEDA